MTDYLETQADHEFSAWLATLTPGHVLRDRERTFSREERKRMKFLRAKAHTEAQRRKDAA